MVPDKKHLPNRKNMYNAEDLQWRMCAVVSKRNFFSDENHVHENVLKIAKDTHGERNPVASPVYPACCCGHLY